MKHILFLSLLFLVKPNLAQTKLKIQKPLTQDKMTSVATLAGLYYGQTSCSAVLNNKKLMISNNTNNLSIYSFDVTFRVKGTLYFYTILGDSLSDVALAKISEGCVENQKPVTTLFISAVKALKKNTADTVFLNPIELKLIKP